MGQSDNRRRGCASHQRQDQKSGSADDQLPHPALTRLCGVLGREAAAYVRRNRYEGLGRLILIENQLFNHDVDKDH